MKCEIIRDLMPIYIDNLTSDESNMEIEEHLKVCSECSEIYNLMITDTSSEKIEINKDEIKPFKKLNRRVFKSVIITLGVCLVLVASYFYFFVYGWMLESQDVKISYTLEDEQITINFKSEEGKALTVWQKRDDGNSNESLVFRQSFLCFLDDRGKYPNEFSYGAFFIKDDKDQIIPFSDRDYVILKFKDKTETLYWKDILKSFNGQN